ncbi:MAG: ankyrin repeat domain-containing protein [Acidobacteria bacterium]|nr:ankyrin repeat domain-containing protein [Acidobacteriota bacterium]
MTTMRILAASVALGFAATSGLVAAGAGATQASDASLTDLALRSTVAPAGATADFSNGAREGINSLADAIGSLFQNTLESPLSGEEISLAPAFERGVLPYTASVPFGVTSVAVIATRSQPGASVEASGTTADGTPLATGTSIDGYQATLPDGSVQILDITRTFPQVPTGSSTITIEVTGEDGGSSEAYTIVLLRSPPKPGDAAAQTQFFHEAMLGRDPDGAVEAVEAGVDVNQQLRFGRQLMTPLSAAIALGYEDVVRSLLQAEANLEAGVEDGDGEIPDGTSPLMMAAALGRETIVRMLIEAGAEVNRRLPIPPPGGEASVLPEATALHFAVNRGQERSVSLLIEAAADVNQRLAVPDEVAGSALAGAPPLLLALNLNDSDTGATIAHLLIDAGADANYVVPAVAAPDARSSFSGASVLILAAFRGMESTVRRLIEAGADVNYLVPGERGAGGISSETAGMTPVRAAERRNHAEIAALLREAGAER